ncbi:hypothetical protein F5Y08DRAFT_334784 [Xylaria arbuscula]|nr:hypothetical protein F5Y08DRAFT_334784 [Xylaria arbuscula]
MPPKQDESEELRRAAKVARLAEEPEKEERIDLLTTATLVTQINIMETALADQGNELMKMRDQMKEMDGNPKLLDRITKEIRSIHQDAASLRQFVEASDQKNMNVQLDLQQLNTNLAGAVKQMDADRLRNKEGMDALKETVEELAEKQKQHATMITEAIEKRDQHTNTLICASRELKFIFEGLSFNTEHIQTSIVSLERAVAGISRPINLLHAATAYEVDMPGQLSGPEPAQRNRKHFAVSDADISGPALTESGGICSDQFEKFCIRFKHWPAVVEFFTVFEESKAAYKSKQPESESEFIKDFLSAINIHSSCLLQRHLLHRRKVELITEDIGQQPRAIFIDMHGLTWTDVKREICKIGLESIQAAVDKKLSGPKHRKPSTRLNSLEEPPAELPPARAEGVSKERKRTSRKQRLSTVQLL